MHTKSTVTAFDWGRSKVSEPVAEEKPRKFPIGTVTKTSIQTLPQLATEFKLAGGGPLKFVDSKGKLICQIFAANSQLQGAVLEVPLNRMLENTLYLLGRAGDRGVIRIIRKGPGLSTNGTEVWPTVAYFTGKDFELNKV